MKKVCVFHHVNSFGGGTKSFIDVINMLKNEYHVVACIPKGNKELVNILKINNIELQEISLPIACFPYYSGSSSLISKSMISALFKIKHIKALVNEVLSIKPDVIIFNTVVTCILAKYFPGEIVKICFVRETFRQTYFDRIYRFNLNKYFNGVIFIAEHEREYLKLEGVPTEVIPDCLEPQEVIPLSKIDACNYLGINPQKYNILFLGGTAQLKGGNLIMESLTYLDCNYFLLFGGNFDEDRLKLRSILSKFYRPRYVVNQLLLRKYYTLLSRRNQIHKLGFIKNISTVMSAADVVVFPSLQPHQPRPCIEAGEYKKPVILTDFKATKEYFRDGYNAIVFNPKDSKHLADKIRHLSNNSNMANEIGNNNYRMTKQFHNYEATKNKLVEFLNRLMYCDD